MAFDDGKGQLAPLTDLRASFDVRTGAMTTLERFAAVFDGTWAGLIVPESLAAVVGEQHPGTAINRVQGPEPVLLVNGRCPLPEAAWAGLAVGNAVVEAESGDVVAARVAPERAIGVSGGDLQSLGVAKVAGRALMSRSWHVKTFRDRAIRVDLDLLTREARPRTIPGVTALGAFPVSIHGSARVSPTVVLDAEAGPIVIDEDAVVRPGAIIVGPAYVGVHSTVLERALLKGGTAIGPQCKVAGEVAGTIFQGFANKAHDGHLGDSWVGQWANLGAGTTNSNLLNTYDQVIARATPDGPNERTGEQFLGAIIGDHVKFAICSRIMTGSVLHTGCMFAQTAAISGCVGAFTWGTDAGARRYRLDKFVEVMRMVMGRRKVVAGEAYLERLEQLHASTENR